MYQQVRVPTPVTLTKRPTTWGRSMQEPSSPRISSPRSPWAKIARVCVGLAVIALILNVSLPGEMDGQVQTLSFIRKTLSKVFSSGTAWAAVSFYAGWLLRTPLLAAVGGVGAAVATLFIHYTLGSMLHIYQSGEIATNGIWFIAALLFGGPLGLCGAWAAQASLGGLLARLVVPAGAILEPFVMGKFVSQEISGRLRPWPERYSDMASGPILITLGAAASIYVLLSGLRNRRFVRDEAASSLEA